jgi:SAM-dependent methyltransferase/uncharacterized protein YbaR (Trm112 family)
MKADLLRVLRCPDCESELHHRDEQPSTGDAECLECSKCQARYPVVMGIPELFVVGSEWSRSTSRLYSDIWKTYTPKQDAARSRHRGYDAPATNHVELLTLASGHPIVSDGVGIDAGCGNGGAAAGMAAGHSQSHVIGIDLSEGPLTKAQIASESPNLDFVRGDLLDLPFARSSFDFVYSFGVLHHTPDPRMAFEGLVERLKPGGRITVFVYKDFSDLPAKRRLLQAVNQFRHVTTRLPPKILRFLSRVIAPLVFLTLTVPARGMRRVGFGWWARHIPYGTFPGLSAIASSLEDRFGAPYEFRFSRATLQEWADSSRLADVRVVDCLPWGFSGLVLTGIRQP